MVTFSYFHAHTQTNAFWYFVLVLLIKIEIIYLLQESFSQKERMGLALSMVS